MYVFVLIMVGFILAPDASLAKKSNLETFCNLYAKAKYPLGRDIQKSFVKSCPGIPGMQNMADTYYQKEEACNKVKCPKNVAALKKAFNFHYVPPITEQDMNAEIQKDPNFFKSPQGIYLVDKINRMVA